jgi:hypothetical protein
MVDRDNPIGPVAVAEAVRVALAAVVTAGWLVIPSATINAIVSTVAFVVSILGSVMARRRVTPVAKNTES